MKSKSQGWYLSSKRLSVVVEVRGNKVVRTPTRISQFRGKSLDELRQWMQSHGGYKESQLSS